MGLLTRLFGSSDDKLIQHLKACLSMVHLTILNSVLDELPKRCNAVLNTADMFLSVRIVFTGGIVCTLAQRPNMPVKMAEEIVSVADSVCHGASDLVGEVFTYLRQNREIMHAEVIKNELSLCEGAETCTAEWVMKKLIVGGGDIEGFRCADAMYMAGLLYVSTLMKFVAEEIETCTRMSPPQSYIVKYQG